MEDKKEQDFFDIVVGQQKYHSKKAGEYKRRNTRFKYVLIITSALIPFFIAVLGNHTEIANPIIAFLGLVIVCFEGINSHLKDGENWILFRNTSESLKRELRTYKTQVKPYDKNDRFDKFVLVINRILDDTNAGWTKSHQSSEDNGQ